MGWNSVKSMVLMGLCGVIFPVALLGILAAETTRWSVWHLVQNDNIAAARIAAEYVQREVEQITERASLLAALPQMIDAAKQRDEAAVRQLLAAFIATSPASDRAFVTDQSGRLWSDFPAAPEALGKSFANRDWYRGVSHRWQPYISDVYRRLAAPSLLVVAMARPIHDQNHDVVGILVFQYRLHTMTDWIQRIVANGESSITLIDSAGELVGEPSDQSGGPGQKSFQKLMPFQRALVAGPWSGEYRDPLTAVPMIGTFMPINVADKKWVVVASQPRAAALAPIRQVQFQIGAGIGIVLIAAAGVTLSIARKNRRIASLNQELQDENQLLDTRVHERTVELEDMNRHLLAEVGARAQAEHKRDKHFALEQTARAEAERLYREATEANRLKDDFLATVSHELRTPIAVISGFTELLQMDTQNFTDEQSKALAAIGRSARAQTTIVNDLLDVSRIITGKLVLKPQPVDLKAIMEAAVSVGRLAASGKSIALSTECDISAMLIYADPDRLQQVIWNLVVNALKFTPAGGHVTVRAKQVQDTEEISVADDGQGIAGAFLPYVFDRFRQQDSSITRLHGGMGLGLAIVRHLVELHGGSVKAESSGIGQGATFTVTIPLAGPIAYPNKTPQITAPAALLPPGAVLPLKPLAGLKILVVDDVPEICLLASTVLGRAGASVTVAGSAAAARLIMASSKPDVLVSDIGMPEEDGFSFIRALRQQEGSDGPHLLAIALTAYAREEDQRKVIEAGFDGHISKPVDRETLVATLAAMARRLPLAGTLVTDFKY